MTNLMSIEEIHQVLAAASVPEGLRTPEMEDCLQKCRDRATGTIKIQEWEDAKTVTMAVPPRPWVGLTYEERKSIREWRRIQDELGPMWAPMMLYLYEAIEAKLKEKNT